MSSPLGGPIDDLVIHEVDKYRNGNKGKSSGGNGMMNMFDQIMSILQMANKSPEDLQKFGPQFLMGNTSGVGDFGKMTGFEPMGQTIGFTDQDGNVPGTQKPNPNPTPPPGETTAPVMAGPEPPGTPATGDVVGSVPGLGGVGDVVNQAQQATAPTKTPASLNAPVAGDTGFSANFGQDAMEGLSQDPVALTRQWMLQNGMDPDSNNPLIQARNRRGQRAKGTYDLMARTGEGAGSNPSIDQFIDFFSGFMENGMTPGAAPMLTPDMATQLLTQAVNLAQGGDTFWGGRLGADAEVDPITGENYTTPQDQAAAMAELLASAFGGTIDPTMLRAMMEQMDRAQLDFRTGAFTPGKDMGGTPAVNDGEDFFDWLVRAGQIPMGIGSGS